MVVLVFVHRYEQRGRQDRRGHEAATQHRHEGDEEETGMSALAHNQLIPSLSAALWARAILYVWNQQTESFMPIETSMSKSVARNRQFRWGQIATIGIFDHPNIHPRHFWYVRASADSDLHKHRTSK